jgi:nicotinate phosphoribosyltransferase
MLDAAELHDAVIVASNDLDEYEIEKLTKQGARVDVWGVGTRLATAFDQPALGGVYKLSAIRSGDGKWEHKLKLSEHPIKVSTPGILQTRRFLTGDRFLGDVVFDESLGLQSPVTAIVDAAARFSPPTTAEAQDMLVPVLRGGELVYQVPSIHATRRRVLDSASQFRHAWADTGSGTGYPVGIEQRLFERKLQLMESLGVAGS